MFLRLFSISSQCFDSKNLFKALTVHLLIHLRIKAPTNLSLKVKKSRFLLYFPKQFHPEIASVKQSLIPNPQIFCISTECLAYIQAKHDTSDLKHGYQICLQSVKLLPLKTECSVSPLRVLG